MDNLECTCPHCQNIIEYHPDSTGTVVTCPHCNQALSLPEMPPMVAPGSTPAPPAQPRWRLPKIRLPESRAVRVMLAVLLLACLAGLPGDEFILVASVLFFGFAIYFLPWLLALDRRHRNAVAIFLINFFFGWTVFGWFVALIWAVYREKPTVASALVPLLFGAPISSFAQTKAQVITTNLIQAHPSFRVVGGQIYNVEKSVKWESLEGDYVQRITEGVVFRKFTIKRYYAPPAVDRLSRIGAFPAGAGAPILDEVGSEKIYGDYFLVQNFPIISVPEPGKSAEFKAFPKGTTSYRSRVINAYDYGFPHSAMVVQTNWIAAPKPKSP